MLTCRRLLCQPANSAMNCGLTWIIFFCILNGKNNTEIQYLSWSLSCAQFEICRIKYSILFSDIFSPLWITRIYQPFSCLFVSRPRKASVGAKSDEYFFTLVPKPSSSGIVLASYPNFLHMPTIDPSCHWCAN